MRVNCDLCGGQPAAVLCCADEAALCTGCDRSIHGANKLASKHRRIPLLHPAGASSGDSTAAPPLCDVCKERRGLVFCVEDRAILCAECDDPIHSANDLTAKHSRFLLVGAKLSAAQEEEDGVAWAQDDVSFVVEGGGGAMISDYLTNICPGWRVDEFLLDDSAFPAAPKARRDETELVPSMDADLFDVVKRGASSCFDFEDEVPTAMAAPTAPKMGRASTRETCWNSDVSAGRSEKRGAWAPSCTGALSFEDEVPIAMAAPTAAAKALKLGRGRETYWSSDSDVFAVPEITPPPAKKARPSSFLRCS